jgi:ABC-type Fe3+-hydroxamate transport system substrate-binding protein
MSDSQSQEIKDVKRTGRLITYLFVLIPLILIVVVVILVHSVSRESRKSLSAGKTFYSLEQKEGYIIARDATGRPLVLVEEGGRAPTDYPPNQIVKVPVKRVVVATGEFDTGLMETMGMGDSVIGLSMDVRDVQSPGLLERYKEGLITFTGDSMALNYEVVKSTDPDLVLCPSLRSAEILEEMGVPTSVTYSPLDNSLEARMFYVEYLTAFGHKEDRAKEFQENFQETLEDLKNKAQGLPKASVMWAVIFEKRVFVEPGENWVGEIVPQLGANYLFSDIKGDSTIEVTLEHFVDQGRGADILILYPGMYQGSASKEDLIRQNQNIATIRPLSKDGRTYVTLPIFYESFGRLPEICQDLFNIFHPEQNPGAELKFFQELK